MFGQTGRGAFQAFLLLAGSWQLQHCRGLIRDKVGYHHNAPVRQFERVVVDVGILHVDLAKSRNLLTSAPLAEQEEWAFAANFFVERQFRPWTEADRNIGFTDRCEAAGE